MLLDDLRQEISRGRVLVIAGAGVSVGATGSAVASWIGLLKDGVARCTQVVPGLDATWATRQLAGLDSADIDELVAVASKIESKLGAPAGGEYRRWLRDSVGALLPKHTDVLEALRDLAVPLSTTNYDGMLEAVTGQRQVTWRDAATMSRVARGDERRVVHFHGHWEDPESVILGSRSYATILGNEFAQAMQHALRFFRTLLFVGFGGGLEDPNFGAFLRWSREVFAEDEYRHFRLARSAEVAQFQAQHSKDERVFVLPYGEKHEDLAPFLRSLIPPGGGPRGSHVPPTLAMADAGAAANSTILATVVNQQDIDPLLQKVQQRASALAEVLAEASVLARRRGAERLSRFCQHELTGYTADVVDKRDPDFPSHRVVTALCSPFARINPGAFDSPTAALQHMRASGQFAAIPMIIAEPILSIERRVASAPVHLRQFILTFERTVAEVFPAFVGKFGADKPVVCYTTTESYEAILDATRAVLTRQLLEITSSGSAVLGAVQGVPFHVPVMGSSNADWDGLLHQNVQLEPLFGIPGTRPPDTLFMVERVSDRDVTFSKLSSGHSITLPLSALSRPWGGSPRRATIERGLLQFDTHDMSWRWRIS